MTACFKLMKALHSKEPHPTKASLCEPCVYFSKNLDKNQLPALADSTNGCGLGFIPGDNGCIEMRTDNCSTRKSK